MFQDKIFLGQPFMASVQSWGWYSYGTTWPGFDFFNPNNLNHNGDGISVDPAGYVEITMNDYSNDGIIYDEDGFDGSSNGGETLSGPAPSLTPLEIAVYSGSSIVMNGQTISNLNLEVTLFTDGTYSVRLLDSEIPSGHYSSVESITLGTWNEVEYAGIELAAVDQMFVCYVEGTMIETVRGFVPVQQLKIGDLVETLDHGLQPVRWIGTKTVMGLGPNAPVRIDANVFDNEVPVYLSPQHRVLQYDSTVDLLFAAEEVFVSAKHLVDGLRVVREPRPLVTYVHFALPQHEVVMADGLLSESLLPGPEALDNVSKDDLESLYEAFPYIRDDWDNYGPSARMCLSGREAELLKWARERKGQMGRADSPSMSRVFEPG